MSERDLDTVEEELFDAREELVGHAEARGYGDLFTDKQSIGDMREKVRSIDDRHKHVYTALASAYIDDAGTTVLPVTFIDYTHTTLYSDLNATGVLGDGLDAYNDRHRATSIWWER
jgi:hypothetical protein